MTALDLRAIARALGGEVSGRRVAPGLPAPRAEGRGRVMTGGRSPKRKGNGFERVDRRIGITVANNRKWQQSRERPESMPRTSASDAASRIAKRPRRKWRGRSHFRGW
jgi:hypothetical protein